MYSKNLLLIPTNFFLSAIKIPLEIIIGRLGQNSNIWEK
jgi:hypothetical protein